MLRRVLLTLLVVASTGLLWHPDATAAQSPIGFVGDSITHSYKLPERTPELVGQLLGVPVVDRGIGGTTTRDWLPGGTLLAPAIAAFRAAHVRVVQVALGTNDAIAGLAPTHYRDQLARIAATLSTSGFTVVLADPPSMMLGGMGGYVTTRGIALLQAYRPMLDGIANGQSIIVGETGAWEYFHAHPDQLWDGVHPGPIGSFALAELWVVGLAHR